MALRPAPKNEAEFIKEGAITPQEGKTGVFFRLPNKLLHEIDERRSKYGINRNTWLILELQKLLKDA
jgi:hypothetical protein